MKKSNMRAASPKPKIQCVEILVSKRPISSRSNLLWTLTVYSLENQPVKKNLSLKDSEVFHFMVYDWNKTIKNLLDVHQVPYSIVQFFTPETLFPETPDKYCLSEDENGFLLAVRKLEDLTGFQAASEPEEDFIKRGAESDLILHESEF